MKDYLKSIPATTLIVTFFFVCGGLYLIGYWSTFDIEISNIVSFTDIPKSFIMPFVLSCGMILLNSLIDIVNAPTQTDDQFGFQSINTTKKKTLWKKLSKVIFSTSTFISICFIAALVCYSDYKNTSIYWLISSFAIAAGIALKLEENKIVKQVIPYFFIRSRIVSLLVYAPILSFGIGKAKSESVYNNRDVRYISEKTSGNKMIINDTISLKLIGFLGDKIIVSSLNNKRIIVLNQSAFDAIEIDTDRPKR